MNVFGHAGAILPQLTNQYEFTEKPLGKGATSIVFLGKLSEGHFGKVWKSKVNFMAAKVFKASKAPDDTDKKMAQEVTMLAQVPPHPNVVNLMGCIQVDDENASSPPKDTWGILFEYVPGESLTAAGVLEETRAVKILTGILSGLEHLHNHQVVHRDVKNDNVHLAEGDNPIIIDFGLAASMKEESILMMRCGTPGFVAPEIIRGGVYTAKGDAFSCGVLMYHMLSGQLPFAGQTTGAVLKRTLRCKLKFTDKFAGISKSCKALLMLLITKEPEERISCADTLELPWVRKLIEKEPKAATVPKPPEERPAALPGIEVHAAPTQERIDRYGFFDPCLTDAMSNEVGDRATFKTTSPVRTPPAEFFNVFESEHEEGIFGGTNDWASLHSATSLRTAAQSSQTTACCISNSRPRPKSSIRPIAKSGWHHRNDEGSTGGASGSRQQQQQQQQQHQQQPQQPDPDEIIERPSFKANRRSGVSSKTIGSEDLASAVLPLPLMRLPDISRSEHRFRRRTIAGLHNAAGEEPPLLADEHDFGSCAHLFTTEVL